MPGCASGKCGRRDYDHLESGMVHGSTVPAWMPLRRDRFHCYLCYVMPLKFPDQPPPPKDHHKEGAADTRDGDPKLAAERKRDPVFTKRQRAGPNYVPAARRV